MKYFKSYKENMTSQFQWEITQKILDKYKKILIMPRSGTSKKVQLIVLLGKS